MDCSFTPMLLVQLQTLPETIKLIWNSLKGHLSHQPECQCSVPPEGCAWGIGAGPAKPFRAPTHSNTAMMHWCSIKANTSLIIVLPSLSSELHHRISWINIYNAPGRQAGIISPCFKDGRRWEKDEAICCNSLRKSVVRQGRVQCSQCLCLCHKTILPVPKCQAPAWWCAVVLAY